MKAKISDEKKVEIIVQTVSLFFGLSPIEIFCKTRKFPFKTARQIIQYMVKKNTTMSLADIGKISLLYGREKAHDHSTVLYSSKTVENLKETDSKYSLDLSLIEKSFKEKTNTLTEIDIENLKNQEIQYYYEDIVLKKNAEIEVLKNKIKLIKENLLINSDNIYLKQLMILDKDVIERFCENTLKPFLLMNSANQKTTA